MRWLATTWVEFFRGVPVLLLIFFIFFGLPKYGIDMTPFPRWSSRLGSTTARNSVSNLPPASFRSIGVSQKRLTPSDSPTGRQCASWWYPKPRAE